MGVRFPSVSSSTFVGPLPANATETVICTTPPLTLPLDFAMVMLFWEWSMTSGTATTSIIMRLRRGTTVSGTLVNTNNYTISTPTAGNAYLLTGCFFDTPGAVGPIQYSLTTQQNAATGAGTNLEVALMAFAL